MHAPRTSHLLVAQRISCYFQGNANHGLVLKRAKTLSVVVAYSDADWAGCSDISRSTTGYVVFLGPNLVSLRSKK